MISHIPFIWKLLEEKLFNGKKTTTSHVLVYGAIEFHSSGPLGCIASNKNIAQTTGLTEATVANIISTISKSGWIKVVLTKQNKRVKIIPLLDLKIINSASSESDAEDNSASSTDDAGLHPPMNIDTGLKTDLKVIDKSITKKEDVIDKNVSEDDIRLTNLLFDLMKQNHSHITREPSKKDFKDMSLLRRSDNRDTASIEFVIKWSQQDPFWNSNILSVTKLRKQFDQLVIRIKQDAQKQALNQALDLSQH
jgi:DNA-binding MarR family transcriptional regulator